MIEIRPKIDSAGECPYCGTDLVPQRVLWQGVHTCAVQGCPGCGAELVADLPTGHALGSSYQVDVARGRLFGPPTAAAWLGNPLLDALVRPVTDATPAVSVERFRDCREVVILNCLDYLFGHSLLKLLNASRHLGEPSPGLVLIVPRFLRWMVPAGAAEIWTVDLPPSAATRFYPALDAALNGEMQRFDRVFLSRAFSHPRRFDIADYTGVGVHDFAADGYRVTFVWREDRPWVGTPFGRVAHRKELRGSLLRMQHARVRALLARLRERLPAARLTVAGIGVATRFPAWVDDRRVDRFTESAERALCEVYRESRLVIGVHGSNMLLPSAHAGLTLDLMPADRWGNFAQDVLFQESDPRLAVFRYRFVGQSATPGEVARIATSQVADYDYFRRQMLNLTG